MYVLVGTTVGDFVGNLWMTWLKPLYMTLLESWSEPLSVTSLESLWVTWLEQPSVYFLIGVFVGVLVGTTVRDFVRVFVGDLV
jgi:hypothetical protein